MTRSKPQSIVHTIKDNKQADEVLAELAQISRSIEASEADLNQSIAELKAETEAHCEPKIKRKKALETSLMAYAEYNKNELFKDKRSVELLYGFFGYRKSSVLKPISKTTWAMVMGKLKQLGQTNAIRTKQTVDKDELATWPTERLETIDVKRTEKDTFWYETKKEDLDAA